MNLADLREDSGVGSAVAVGCIECERRDAERQEVDNDLVL